MVVKPLLHWFSVGRRRSNGIGLVLLLLLVVLVPSVCLLWFMNQAVQNERLAVRQKLMEAYRVHLALAQERLATFWRETSIELDTQATKLAAPVFFERQIESGLADAVVCLDQNGAVAYPDTPLPPKLEPPDRAWNEVQMREATEPLAAADACAVLANQATNTDLAARALQAQARCLIHAGKKEAALEVLLGPLAENRLELSTDAQGTLIAPNAALLALELLRGASAGGTPAATLRATSTLDHLQARLRDYRSSMPVSQRRFLMHELQALFPDAPRFPTCAAEDLAARYLEAGAVDKVRRNAPTDGSGRDSSEGELTPTNAGGYVGNGLDLEAGAVAPGIATLPQTSLPDVWQITPPQRPVGALYRTETFLHRMQLAPAPPSFPPHQPNALLPPHPP